MFPDKIKIPGITTFLFSRTPFVTKIIELVKSNLFIAIALRELAD